jgi:hypothetical protein
LEPDRYPQRRRELPHSRYGRAANTGRMMFYRLAIEACAKVSPVRSRKSNCLNRIYLQPWAYLGRITNEGQRRTSQPPNSTSEGEKGWWRRGGLSLMRRVAVCVLAGPGGIASQNSSFRVQTQVVQVPVSITGKHGQGVNGLTARDFQTPRRWRPARCHCG